MDDREWGELSLSSSRGWVRSYAAIAGKTMDESKSSPYSLLPYMKRIVLLPGRLMTPVTFESPIKDQVVQPKTA
jgi:hypothetical protein